MTKMLEHDNLQNADGEKEIVTNSISEENKLIDSNTLDKAKSLTANNANISETKESSTKTKHKDAVEEIEASNAEDAEDEANKERHNVEEKDYHAMSMDALVDEMDKLLKNHKIQTISKQINTIKSEFNQKFNALLEEKKDDFINDGGDALDFYYTNDSKKRFNTLYKNYKKNINTYYNDREQQLKQNLANRLAIIDEIKSLVNVEENINTTYKQFKALQEKWRNSGPIPRDKYNNAWNSYHHHVERFYDFLHLNNDFRDMDFKHNYEKKLKIIERAEALAKDDDVNRSFRELQVLHKIWKEDLGPVAKEHRETIWERFSNATKTIHHKRQLYYADLDKAYEKNLEKKEAIIAQIKAIAEQPINSHGAWQKKIKDIESLRDAFFNAGKVPLNVNEQTWAKFKEAVRSFNRNKNKFYKELKKEQYNNLKKKQDLIKVAEDNKDSNDFETVTPLMKKIQANWKAIGHVPRRDSDKIWKQFKNACNHYFDRLHAQQKLENSHLYEAFDKKIKLLDTIKNFSYSQDVEADISLLKQKIAEWKTIGHVPQNKRYIDAKFYKAIDTAFEKLNVENSKLDMLKFESKLETFANAEDSRLLDNEQNFIRKKIADIKSDITQLENNLQFFSNVNQDNPLVKDVYKNIDNHKKELDTWKAKLTKIKALYS